MESAITFDNSEYFATLRFEIIVTKKLRKKYGAIAFSHPKGIAVGFIKQLLNDTVQIRQAELKAFTDKELGIKRLPCFKYPIGILKVARYDDKSGNYKGECIYLDKPEDRSYVLANARKYYPNRRYVCRTLNNGRMAVFRVDHNNKIPRPKAKKKCVISNIS